MTARTRAQPPPIAAARPEPAGKYRVPSGYTRCRVGRCMRLPVADMNRAPHPRTGRILWYAYCPFDLAEYNREVRDDGRVWWRGAKVGVDYTCMNCSQPIRLASDQEGWEHTATSSVWCDSSTPEGAE